MVPEIFLSLSGRDELFAKQVYEALPHGMAKIYHHTFQNGESLINEMTNGVNQSAIVVLMASHDSLSSHWVNFELDLARVNQIQRNIKILAFPLEPDIRHSEYPKWMQESWISSHILNPKDIARHVQEILFSDDLLGIGAHNDVIGRGQLLDISRRHFLSITAQVKKSPNVFLFSGTTQIGRRTFAKYALKSLFPAKPSLVAGPHLDLPQFADISDIYRGLLDHVHFSATRSDIERNLTAFLDLDIDDQISEVCALLEYYNERGLATFIYTGSGFFNEDGSTKTWFWPLVDQLAETPSAVLVGISNRRFREDEVIAHPNALQMHVPALLDHDTAALVTATATAYGIEPFTFSDGLNRAIGGHPGVTKSAVRLVANSGLDLVERQPQSVFNAQNYILSHNIDEDNLSETQKDVLFVLSWLPSLRGDLLAQTLNKAGRSDSQFIASIDELMLSCLIIASDDGYAISKELREIFRRRYGFGNDTLIGHLGDVLTVAWKASESDGSFDANLIDSVVFMHALAGKAIPESLMKVVLPSKFAEILRTRYNQGRDDRNALLKIVEWGLAVLQMRSDEAVKEEVLGIVVQSYVRLKDFTKADVLLGQMDSKGYRSTPFLRGFRLRREGKVEEAIPVLRDAIHTRKNLRYSVQELATIFHRMGRDKDLNDLLLEHRSVVNDSAVLLDFEIGLKVSENDFTAADALIADLESLPQDDGRSTIRRAQIESQRWGNHRLAFDKVNELVLGGIGDQVRTRRWRAMFAGYAGEEAIAIRDIEFLRSRNEQEAVVDRLLVHQAIGKGDGKMAEAASAKLDMAVAQNKLLRARALDLLIETGKLGIADKNALEDEAATLRANARGNLFDV